MKKLASTITALEDIGLESLSSTLRKIQKLYKYADTDFSKEVEVFSKLLEIANHFKGKSPNSIAPSGLSLPPFSIETEKQYVIYSGDELSGYTKRQIFATGIPNFLKNFSEKYLETKKLRSSRADSIKYDKIIEEIQRLNKVVSSAYRVSSEFKAMPLKDTREKLTKEELSKDLRRIGNIIKDMSRFQVEIEDHFFSSAPTAHGLARRYISDPDNYDDILKVENAPRTRGTSMFNDDTAIRELKKLSIDFEDIQNTIDSEFASKLGVSPEEFRKQLGIDKWLSSYIVRVASTIQASDNEDINLSEDQEDEDEDSFALATEKNKTKHSTLPDDDSSKATDPEDSLLKLKNIPKSEEFSERLQKTEDLKKMFKDIVSGIISEKIDGKQIPFDPMSILECWDYAHEILAKAYKTLVVDAQRFFQGHRARQEQISQSSPSATKDDEMNKIDNSLIDTVSNIIKFLR